jgi:hypothetical protein
MAPKKAATAPGPAKKITKAAKPVKAPAAPKVQSEPLAAGGKRLTIEACKS